MCIGYIFTSLLLMVTEHEPLVKVDQESYIYIKYVMYSHHSTHSHPRLGTMMGLHSQIFLVQQEVLFLTYEVQVR